MDLCLIWPVARLNMHAGVSECHQRPDGCVLSRPRDHKRVNLGERVQRVFVKLNSPIQKGLRVCPFESKASKNVIHTVKRSSLSILW